jgi:hypothetical protein
VTLDAPPTLETLAEKLDAVLLAVKQQSDAPRFLSIEGGAGYCSVSAESIRKLISTGRLTALRPIKGRVLIDRFELDSVVLSSTQRPRSGRGRR